jgi:TPR repeat protein
MAGYVQMSREWSIQAGRWILFGLLSMRSLQSRADFPKMEMPAVNVVLEATSVPEMLRDDRANETAEERFNRIYAMASGGDVHSQYVLAVLFCSGIGTPRDNHQAFVWYSKAAESGSKEAENDLGFCYSSGSGVEQDYGRAMQWYQKAAAQGYTWSFNNIGNLYLKGRGVETNVDEALRWFSKAADQGLAQSQHALAVVYASPTLGRQNWPEAIKWAQKSAEQGFPVA